VTHLSNVQHSGCGHHEACEQEREEPSLVRTWLTLHAALTNKLHHSIAQQQLCNQHTSCTT